MEVEPDDEVVVAGTASSPRGLRLNGERCVVAAVDREGIQLWPLGPFGEEHPKVWVTWEGIEWLEVQMR